MLAVDELQCIPIATASRDLLQEEATIGDDSALSMIAHAADSREA